MKLLPFVSLVFLSGCSTISTGYHDPLDRSWQAIHVVDTLQTASLHSSRCYEESETAYMLGRHPTVLHAAVWGVAGSVWHAYITGLLIEHDHPTLAGVWNVLTLVDTAHAVGNNYSVGVKIGSSNSSC